MLQLKLFQFNMVFCSRLSYYIFVLHSFSVSISGSNSRMFVSGSCDATARLWDTRAASRAVRTFHGHEGDVNTVRFFPDGNRFGTGSDDGTCRLFDIRTGHELQVYYQQHGDNEVPHVTSIAFSISGRLLFAGYSNGDCYVWDTLLAKVYGSWILVVGLCPPLCKYIFAPSVYAYYICIQTHVGQLVRPQSTLFLHFCAQLYNLSPLFLDIYYVYFTVLVWDDLYCCIIFHSCFTIYIWAFCLVRLLWVTFYVFSCQCVNSDGNLKFAGFAYFF